MKVTPSKLFLKHYPKLNPKQQAQLQDRIELFLTNPYHPQLHNHGLRGQYKGLRSLNVGGDLRVIFENVNENEVLLVDIGTHSQLYS